MSSHHRDYQKSKVYAWESKVVAPRNKRIIDFKDAQAAIDGIFLMEQWIGPPKVAPMPKQARRVFATGCRTQIQLPEKTPEWILLHELAHVLTTEIDDYSEGHGPDYMGVYLKLLDKYGGVSLLLTTYSLQFEKIKYNLTAIPTFKRD